MSRGQLPALLDETGGVGAEAVQLLGVQGEQTAGPEVLEGEGRQALHNIRRQLRQRAVQGEEGDGVKQGLATWAIARRRPSRRRGGRWRSRLGSGRTAPAA